MQKAMISQPMANRTEEEIVKAREKAKVFLESKGYEVINTKFDDWHPLEDTKNIPLAFLAKSLESMSKCDMVYFCDGWRDARGCVIENVVAYHYGLDDIYESKGDQEFYDKYK